MGLLMVLEWMDGGSLLSLLREDEKSKVRLTTVQKVQICKQIANGLSLLHENGVIHRDLAARNCVVLLTFI
jgi:serine/threonine protein kinase